MNTRSMLWLVLMIMVGAANAGCGHSGPPRAPIRGQVQIAGQPLPQGRVLFSPLAPQTGPTVSAVVIDGRYELPASQGPLVGRNRVQVEAHPDLGFALDDESAYAQRGGQPLPADSIPPEYSRQSQLVCEVSASAENRFDILIPVMRR